MMKYLLQLLLIATLIPYPTQGAARQTSTPEQASPVPLPPGAVARFGQGVLDHVEVSPDNKYIAVGGSIGVVVYASNTLQPVWSAAASVTTMKWSPNSQLLAACCGTGIVVWNGQTGKLLYRLTGYGAANLQWTPDGKSLVLDGDAIWKIGSTQPIKLARTDEGEYKGYGILFSDGFLSPDGQLLATTYDIGSPDANYFEGVVIIWDVATGTQKRILSFQRFSFSGGLLWFPDSKHLLVTSDNGFTEWDTASGRQINAPFAINRDLSPDNNNWIEPPFVTPQGRFLAWEHKGGDVPHLVDIQTGDAVYQDADNEKSEYFSPDFKMVAVYKASDNEVVIRKFPSGEEISHLWQVTKIAAMSSDWQIWVAWEDPYPDTLGVWGVQSDSFGTPLATKSAPLQDVAWSSDGSQIATIDETGTVVIRNPRSRVINFTFDNSSGAESSVPVARIAFSSDGTRFVTLRNGSLVVRNVASGPDYTLSLTMDQPYFWDRMAWSPDTTHIVLSNEHGDLAAVDLATGRVQHANETSDDSSNLVVSYGVAWSPDGKHIAAGGHEGKVNIRDATSLKITTTLKYSDSTPDTVDWVDQLAYSPNGQSLAALVKSRSYQFLVITDLQSGKVHSSQIADDFSEPTSLVWSPDGKKMAVGIGSSWFGLGWSPRADGPIILFNAQTAQQLTVLYGHSRDVEGVAFSPDSKQLAAASLDGTVLIWDISGL